MQPRSDVFFLPFPQASRSELKACVQAAESQPLFHVLATFIQGSEGCTAIAAIGTGVHVCSREAGHGTAPLSLARCSPAMQEQCFPARVKAKAKSKLQELQLLRMAPELLPQPTTVFSKIQVSPS